MRSFYQALTARHQGADGLWYVNHKIRRQDMHFLEKTWQKCKFNHSFLNQITCPSISYKKETPVWQSQLTWGWRGILIWLRMMPRHPGPLIRRRQTRATLIIIRQGLSKVYSKVHSLSLYCDKNLLSASVICRAPLLWGPWRITRRGLVTGSWAGSSADPPSSDARVTWIRVWPGSPGQPPPAPSDFPAQQRLPPRWGERGKWYKAFLS